MTPGGMSLHHICLSLQEIATITSSSFLRKNLEPGKDRVKMDFGKADLSAGRRILKGFKVTAKGGGDYILNWVGVGMEGKVGFQPYWGEP